MRQVKTATGTHIEVGCHSGAQTGGGAAVAQQKFALVRISPPLHESNNGHIAPSLKPFTPKFNSS